tara:strand:+ start:487 stop:783 length:297 start_codon:yes stop_codon:yes gene_type:complete
MSDNINPDHYTKGGVETIDFIAAKMTPEEFYGFIKGNALKYISREGLKSDKLTDKIDDCKKAIWYLEQMITVHQKDIALLEAKVKQDKWIDDELHDED